MGFHGRAWNAAADEYGRQRAEKYGKFALFVRVVQLATIVVLGVGIIVMWKTGH